MKQHMVGKRYQNPYARPIAHNLLFHVALQNEIEQQIVGNWSNIRILVAFAHHVLFHFVLHNEIKQTMVGTYWKIKIFVPSAHHLLFHFVVQNEI